MRVTRVKRIAAALLLLTAAAVTQALPAAAAEAGTAAATTTTTTAAATTTTTTTTEKTTTTTTTAAETKTTKTTTETTTYVVSTSPSESLGSVSFKSSNATRIEVGKSTKLYITTKDMSGSQDTTFSCSNTAVASIEKVSNTCVKVYGLKDGEVVISATVGGKTAKYSLIVGNAQVTAPEGAVTQTTAYISSDPIDFSGLGQDQLSQYIQQNKQNDSAKIIIGIIGWAAILTVFGFVLSVIFRNRTPQMNMYPGTKARFNNSSAGGKRKKRLLPDSYYRSIRKY